jgi:hypothetical protein
MRFKDIYVRDISNRSEPAAPAAAKPAN